MLCPVRIVTFDLADLTRCATEIVIKEGDFKWDPKADNPTLGNINVHIGHRELAMVVGAVGSGKSSLLSCLLGEMPRVNGEVTIKGSVAYVPQEAWIMNATIRENILFGEDMDDDKYNRVLDAAALRPDLAILPAGDFTEIGERGITLSGGQKQASLHDIPILRGCRTNFVSESCRSSFSVFGPTNLRYGRPA